MDLRGRIKDLCNKNNISMNQLEQELGFGKGYISKLGKSTPNAAKIQQLATRLGVSIEYLMNGNDELETEQTFQNTFDISEKLDSIIFDIGNIDENPLYYKGEKIDKKSLAILEQALASAMKQVDIMREKGKKQ